MDGAGTLISVISTLISSIALIAVVIGLLIQVRQIKAAQLQISRVAQAEIVRMAIEDPDLVVDAADRWASTPDAYRRNAFLNLSVKYIELSYSVRAISQASVRMQAAMLFEVEYRRTWWRDVREIYEVEANSRRERQFFSIVDDEFRRASATRNSDGEDG